MSFKQWMDQVNELSYKTISLSVYDLEDYCWRDSYEGEMSPGEALYDFLEGNGYVQRYPELFYDFIEDCEVV
jgi:hypothetical protein